MKLDSGAETSSPYPPADGAVAAASAIEAAQTTPVGARPNYAAIDLGTNNCRLLIARPLAQGFEVIDAFSRIVRLGDGLGRSETLSIPAMDRTVAALKICASKLDRHRPRAIRIVATEACRRARNGAQFLRRVRRETGLDIEVISAGEEAMLALAGCAALLTPECPRALLFDIGGGSTELMWLDAPAEGPPVMRAWISLPTGVVNLADREGSAATTPEGFARMRDRVLGLIQEFEATHKIAAEVAAGRVQMLGCSGTVTTLAGIHHDLPRYDRSKIDGTFLTRAETIAVSQRLIEMDDDQRMAHPCIGKGRADLVVAGCAILAAICHLWPVERLRIADRGVREGILLGLMGAPPPILATPAI
jgi:exopolyphosphatase/guanosine-5'-triphosphate,3'-diphosphate pyrophosphatase